MNRKPLPVGVDLFEMVITRGYYFVDKTLFIKELLDKKGSVRLFTRPRRFGKTLNLSMVQCFFENKEKKGAEKKGSRCLFEGLNIMQAGEDYLSHMGQYPVISLSLKAAKQPDFESSYRLLARQIANEFDRHRYILEDDALAVYKERYLKIMTEHADRAAYCDALEFLSKCLEFYYGRKTIILIDEYDVPLENAYTQGYYAEMAGFVRALFESALKTNSSLEFAVVTGCLRIAKESIFTGMNNLEILSVLSSSYDEFFGFTEKEVRKICEDFHLGHKYAQIKEWYNGYLFGKENVYNPWSVICYVKELTEDEEAYPRAYWANTSANSIVRKLIERAGDDTRQEIESLIEGKFIEKRVHEDITYDEINQSMEHLWNFMFFTGYFRKVSERRSVQDDLYMTLSIPNREVKYIFRTKVLDWFAEKVKEKDRTVLFEALIHQDVQTVKAQIADMLLETISFNDAYESYYHGFLAGIFSGMQGYVTKSNREGGSGRSDLFIRPVSRSKAAYVLEFKISKKYSGLEKKADEALRQIADKGYAKELHDDGYEKVIRYGIAFFGKDCAVHVSG